MERMLLYSLERARPIRLMWLDADGTLRQCSATVTALSDDRVTLRLSRGKKTLELQRQALLAADYKKGDEGDG